MKPHLSLASVRSDHIAGAFFIVCAIIVFALSGDLPFGSLSSPGAGMMPKLLLVLMMAFGIALLFGAAASQPFADIEWSDGAHALMVVLIAGIAITFEQEAPLHRSKLVQLLLSRGAFFSLLADPAHPFSHLRQQHRGKLLDG